MKHKKEIQKLNTTKPRTNQTTGTSTADQPFWYAFVHSVPWQFDNRPEASVIWTQGPTAEARVLLRKPVFNRRTEIYAGRYCKSVYDPSESAETNAMRFIDHNPHVRCSSVMVFETRAAARRWVRATLQSRKNLS